MQENGLKIGERRCASRQRGQDPEHRGGGDREATVASRGCRLLTPGRWGLAELGGLK